MAKIITKDSNSFWGVIFTNLNPAYTPRAMMGERMIFPMIVWVLMRFSDELNGSLMMLMSRKNLALIPSSCIFSIRSETR